ncbi:hypothetical protein G3480_09685 [Thiorhodococcus mannitoliphagus]|uniref:Uncharacterized protein n=1 Tax=Thiorhodococcus mannitoliphagus TaxID=329406 RepID=A0A6P1DRU4_9GAMM|nr:hypothetical protein [Thiorhodococcus mannitoliphagus]NEX20579.1 hypothetical protein [Thiorhodococcus mannitoliphagus]
MKQFDLLTAHLPDTAADSVRAYGIETAALESHLQILNEHLDELRRSGGSAHRLADLELQIARTLVNLERGAEAWPLARSAFDHFVEWNQFELAADACDVLYQAGQPESLAALGQGIWLAVTCPIDPELTVELLNHVIEDTPDESDGAAVAATTALFLADVRAQGRQREDLMFFATQLLGVVARRHSSIDSADELDAWMERLELKEPEKFLVRLRNVVDVLVQDNWWFDREALQEQLPLS